MRRLLIPFMLLLSGVTLPAWSGSNNDALRNTARDTVRDSARDAAHVLNRLAFGPRPGDLERVQAMGVDRYIEEQLQPESIPLPPTLIRDLAALPVLQQSAGETLAQFNSNKQAAAQGDEAAKTAARARNRQLMQQAAQARLLQAIDSPRQLQEVMVDFWFNHFNVFSGKGLTGPLVTSYERDAIRPYAFGRFRDLLGAVAKHPAMLFYLDNWQSAAPDNDLGRRKANGLNENYARELMELHTLGVDGGYTQSDVTALARMFTGWTFQPRMLARRDQGFRFEPGMHDTGTKQWLGRTIGNDGMQEGERALDVLAMHPATARHLSAKLAQAFVQDTPPPALVERLAQRYLATQGDIREVLRTLFFSPEFRAADAAGAKFKTPYRFVISASRAAALPTAELRPHLGVLAQLGMPVYGCQTPDGYRNTEAAWLNPDALTRRIELATAFAHGKLRTPDRQQMDQAGDAAPQAMVISHAPEPAQALQASALLQTLGPTISPATRTAIAAQPPRLHAALVLGSPDFMRH